MRADEQAQRGQAAEAAVEPTATVRVVSVASIRSIKRPSLKGRRGDTYMYTYRHSTEDSCSSSVTSIAASVSGNKRAVSPKVRMSRFCSALFTLTPTHMGTRSHCERHPYPHLPYIRAQANLYTCKYFYHCICVHP